ncbi:hypothetical protein HYDPIDRAFT_40966 [Hydnomerulius pinastri MD-312]|uniref:Uncharacterized protein n=1 Tax=Hydnomerulius pinastri MD-312 TaxID=994086 RepID=A0A0C9VYV2_9AGAM|nr:hypothetical protein HYDPIDRAFT_40966 [Hydnomerulius pinastri MD-312]
MPPKRQTRRLQTQAQQVKDLDPVTSQPPLTGSLPMDEPTSRQTPKRNRASSNIRADKLLGPGKKTKVDCSNEAQSQTSERVTLRLTIPAREPQPPRAKRVSDPAGPDKPRPKRTSEQVAAATERKALQERRLAELEAEKIRVLAEIEIGEMMAEEEENSAAVMHLSDLTGRDEVLEENPASDRSEVDIDIDTSQYHELEGQLESPELTTEPLSASKVQKGKKATKHQVRTAVDKKKEELLAQVKTRKNHGLGESSASEDAIKFPFPSGLSAAWTKRASIVPQPARAKQAAKTPRTTAVEEPAWGGLKDSDISDAEPDHTSHEGLGEIEVVAVTSDNSGSESQLETHSTKSKSKATTRAAPRGVPQTPSVAERRMVTSVPRPLNSPSSSTPGPESFETGGLPEFIRKSWITVFLPTLYRRLGSYHQPFDLYKRDHLLLRTIQEVIDICFPTSGYRATGFDRLCTLAYNRIGDRLSQFGRSAIKNVQSFFDKPPYSNDSRAIAQYAKYATQKDGPAVYRFPSPRGTYEGDPGYQLPSGMFESQFIIDILAHYLNSTKGTTADYGPPIGALAVITAAVERAFFSFHSGSKVVEGLFNNGRFAPVVDDYIDSINKLSPRRWNAIYQLCGVNPAPNLPGSSSGSSLQDQRRTLYMPPSSPIPMEED